MKYSSTWNWSSKKQPRKHPALWSIQVLATEPFKKQPTLSKLLVLDTPPFRKQPRTQSVLWSVQALETWPFTKQPKQQLDLYICFGNDPEIKSLYHNFLFVNLNHLFTTDDISSFMQQSSLPHLSFGLTISTWWHIQTAWKRKLGCATEDIVEMEWSNTIEALQADNSRATETRLYGISVQALANMAEDTLPLYLDASITWQQHCKTFLSGSAPCYKQGHSFLFDHMQSSRTTIFQPGKKAIPKMEGIAQVVGDRLLPTLSVWSHQPLTIHLQGSMSNLKATLQIRTKAKEKRCSHKCKWSINLFQRTWRMSMRTVKRHLFFPPFILMLLFYSTFKKCSYALAPWHKTQRRHFHCSFKGCPGFILFIM